MSYGRGDQFFRVALERLRLRMMDRSKSTAETVSDPITDLTRLPAPVAAIRAKILAACATNDIEALRIPIDWNELRPLFAKGGKDSAYKSGDDPIEFLKMISFDKKGAEVLHILRAALTQPYVTITRANVTLYEWPAFARKPTPAADERDMRARWRCVRFADLTRSNIEGGPRAMRIGVASDGVWHYFWSED